MSDDAREVKSSMVSLVMSRLRRKSVRNDLDFASEIVDLLYEIFDKGYELGSKEARTFVYGNGEESELDIAKERLEDLDSRGIGGAERQQALEDYHRAQKNFLRDMGVTVR